MPMRPTPELTFVLAIAISEYQAEVLKPIPACKTDIRLIEDWFSEGIGLPKRNIRVLTDANATVANIRASFEDHLVANAWQQRQRGNAGDSHFVFYFAGHSSKFRVRDVITGPHYIVDSLPAYDSRVAGETDIFRPTIAGWFQELATVTENVDIIMDCCRTDWTELECRVLLANGAPLSDVPVDCSTRPAGVTENATAGALTGALIRNLKQARQKPATTWSSLYDQILETIRVGDVSQTPVLRGPARDGDLSAWIGRGVSRRPDSS